MGQNSEKQRQAQITVGKSSMGYRSLVQFRKSVSCISYEPRGVLFSEIFFIKCILGDAEVVRILESGRARGQSTHLFALMFSEARIVSVDYEPGTPDAKFAEERLGQFTNVELIYGDSFHVLPKTVQKGDVVFIDGPKGFRALRLAFSLLQHEPGLRAVFLHDFYKGLPERQFLESRCPEALFSDESSFVENTRVLDEACVRYGTNGDGDVWQPNYFHGREQESYGPTVAFLPLMSPNRAGKLLRQAEVAATLGRVKRSLCKRLGFRSPN